MTCVVVAAAAGRNGAAQGSPASRRQSPTPDQGSLGPQWVRQRWLQFATPRGVTMAFFLAASEADRRALTVLFAAFLVERRYKWESVKKALTALNNACQIRGLHPPGYTATNPQLRRLRRAAARSASAQSVQYRGLPLHIAKDMWATATEAASEGGDLGLAAAAALGWFFLLRPGEITRGPLRWRDLRFAARDPFGQWTECSPWEAEVVLVRTVRKGATEPTILARWRSLDPDKFCPVEVASALYHNELVRRAMADLPADLPGEALLFGPGTTAASLRAYVRDGAAERGVPGCSAYSLRVGGAQHLGAHIRQHGDLHLAGGWDVSSPMPSHYAGAAIESTRYWSILMVRPVGLLSTGSTRSRGRFDM